MRDLAFYSNGQKKSKARSPNSCASTIVKMRLFVQPLSIVFLKLLQSTILTTIYWCKAIVSWDKYFNFPTFRFGNTYDIILSVRRKCFKNMEYKNMELPAM